MIAGFALEGTGRRRVIGIDASKTLDQTVEQVTRIANDTAERIGLGRALLPEEICVVDGYAGPVYGIPDDGTIEAIHLAARTEGMLTDPVYEGKSMAGLIGMVRYGGDPRRREGVVCAPRRPACALRLRRDARPRMTAVIA